MKRLMVVFAVLAAMFVFSAPNGVDAKSTPTCKGQKATQWLTSPGELVFTAGDDVFVGSSGDDTFSEGDWGGTDLVCAGGGDDVIYLSGDWSDAYAGSGNDSIYLDGQGRAYGESGDDWISAAGWGAYAYGGSGSDYITVCDGAVADGGSGNDEIYGEWAYQLLGGAGNDYLESDSTIDLIDCGPNNDSLYVSDEPTITDHEDGPTIKRCENDSPI